MVTMSDQRKPKPLEETARLRDPIQRAIDADVFATYCEARAREARTLRNTSLREARKGHSIPKVAELTGINVATVKAVCR
jgi:DNA-binding transcriptional regulator YiaG